MIQGLRHQRAGWLIPCAMVGAVLGGAPVRSGAADDPGRWLEKMNQALANRNYDGTFFHESRGRYETMRIVHRVRGGQVTERLQSLDGPGREFVRDNDELTCYLPDQHTVLVEPRQDRGPFLGALPQFGANTGDYYRLETLPDARILGRTAHVIAVNPKDQYRFGYRLWLDEKTAMPLKTQLCDSHGEVLEQIFFARLDMPDTIADSELAPTVKTEGMRWIRQGPAQQTATSNLSTFRVSELPPGFKLTVEGAQTIGDASAPASHLVYSDGLATVSVFIEAQPAAANPGMIGAAASAAAAAAAAGTPATGNEPPPPLSPDAPVQGLARVGSGYAFSTVVEGHQVTAVGEVPALTVEFIAHSVKGGAEPPHR
jgi:sigma-E factor negative regulatory protein RseB